MQETSIIFPVPLITEADMAPRWNAVSENFVRAAGALPIQNFCSPTACFSLPACFPAPSCFFASCSPPPFPLSSSGCASAEKPPAAILAWLWPMRSKVCWKLSVT